MGGDETTSGGNPSEIEGRTEESFTEYIELLYKEGLQLELQYRDMYDLDLEELQNTIIERRKGLAYKIWRLASFTKHPYISNFPDSPEKAMPELYPPKPTIKITQWMLDKYFK